MLGFAPAFQLSGAKPCQCDDTYQMLQNRWKIDHLHQKWNLAAEGVVAVVVVRKYRIHHHHHHHHLNHDQLQ